MENEVSGVIALAVYASHPKSASKIFAALESLM